MKVIEPSLLAFNVHTLKAQLVEVKQAGAVYIHYDVMDGVFVTNKAFGPQQLLDIHQQGLLGNVHMMVQDPIKWIKDFINFPIHALTFHPEVITNRTCLEAFNLLRTKKIKCGIALKVHVDANQYQDLLKICDYVCVMSVEPGKGGQSFIPEAMSNLQKVKKIKDLYNTKLVIQLDGGVNFDVMQNTKNYVDHFVIGSFLMKQENKKNVFEFLEELK